ncbi:unnamed protein product [Cercospora beticola]|nr:unnamed protein product [Cercospora beticola]
MANGETGIPMEDPVLASGAKEETGFATGIGIEPRADSGGQDTGSTEHDLKAEKEAARPAVMRKLQLSPTTVLRSIRYMRAHIAGMTADDYTGGQLECPFDDNELLDIAKPTMESRMRGEREYFGRLRQECMRLYGDIWTTKIALPESAAEGYEKWLQAGDPFAAIQENRYGWWKFRQRQHEEYRPGCKLHRRACPIGESQLADCGVLLLDNLDLRQMCEVGNTFHLPPDFLADHICPGLYSEDPYQDPYQSREASTKSFFAAGFSTTLSRSARSTVFDVRGRPRRTPKLCSEENAIWLSGLLMGDSFVVIAVNGLKIETPPAGFPNHLILPTPGNIDMMREVNVFLAEKWNFEKLCELWQCCEESGYGLNVFLWQWAVWLYEREIRNIALDLQRIDYECVTLSTSEALDRVKAGRARVAELRKHLAQTRRAVSDMFLEEAYTNARKYQKDLGRGSESEHASSVQHALESVSLTSRQQAASSPDKEHAWLDKQAADLMPRLNENLQVIIATLNVEQSQVALKDAEVSRRNGERSTQLTLLAAIYLPLTLATGIFGMNIRDINSDEVRYWWPIILAIVLMIPSAVVIAYIFWRSRQDRRRERERLDKGEKEA